MFRKTINSLSGCVFFIALCFSFSSATLAQPAAKLSGQVTDGFGGAIPNAKVIIKNNTDSRTISVITDGSGRFETSNISPGKYEVIIEHTGFATLTKFVDVTSSSGNNIEEFVLEPALISENVTVTATRNERDDYEIDVRADKVGRENILKKNVTGTNDILNDVPNLTPVGNGPYSTRPRLRGLDSTRILVLVDGERLNTSRVATDRSGPEIGLISSDQIQSVEIVNGSGSVLYGTDALAGTINIITNQLRPSQDSLRIGGELNTFYSSNETGRRGTGKFDISGRKFAVRVIGGLERYANYDSGEPFGESNVPLLNARLITQRILSRVFPDNFNQPFTRTNSEIQNSQSHGNNLGLNARYFITDKQQLNLSLTRRRNTSIGFPDFVEPFFFQNVTLPFSNYDKSSLRYELSSITDWFTNLTLRGYWQNQDRVLRNNFAAYSSSPPRPGDPPFDSILRTKILSDTRQTVKTFGFEMQAVFVLPKKNIVTTGASFFRDHSRDSRVAFTDVAIIGFASRSPSPPLFIPQNIPLVTGAVSYPQRVPISNFQNLGVFIQDEYEATNWLRFVAGLRYDRFDVDTRPTAGYNPILPGLQNANPPVDLSGLPDPNGQRINRNSVTGSFGVVVRPVSSVSITARIGRSYRHPNLEELFFSGPATIGNIIPNTKVEPETGLNFDFGVKVRKEKYTAAFSYFNNNYRNFISTEIISFSPTAGSGGLITQAVNFLKMRLQGFEADVEVPLKIKSSIFTPFGHAAYLRGTILEGSNPFQGTSLNGAAADNITPFKSVTGLRWETRNNRFWSEYVARIQTHVDRVSPLLTGSPFAIGQDFFGLNGFTVHTIRGGYNINREKQRYGFVIGVENLGNKFYREQFQFAPARGRSFTFGVNVAFF